MHILLARPHPVLLAAKRLQEGFLNLEPLDLEIVAGGAGPDDTVEIFDARLERDPMAAFERKLAARRYDFIGFTGYSSHADTVRLMAARAKALRPEAVTLVGGIHATMAPHDYDVPQIDLIVRGEGATALREILARHRRGDPLHFDGRVLSPRDPDFRARAAGPLPACPEWDEVPGPRRNLVDRSRYFCVWTAGENGRIPTMFPRIATMRTSAGCAFTCSFCIVHQLMGRRYLQGEPEAVVAEIAGVAEDHIYFIDDEMFLNAKRVQRIADLLIERGVRKHYSSWARADTIVRHPEVFERWRQAGLDILYVGLESMSDTGLEDLNKRSSAETNRAAIATLRRLGITLHASFIVRPDFTDRDFDDFEREVRTLGPAEITFTVLSPTPGTELWEQHQGDYIIDPYRYCDCMHTLLPTTLPLKRFYARFGRLTDLAMRANPLRMNKTRVPFHEIVRAIVRGTRYIIAIKTMHRDYGATER